MRGDGTSDSFQRIPKTSGLNKHLYKLVGMGQVESAIWRLQMRIYTAENDLTTDPEELTEMKSRKEILQQYKKEIERWIGKY